MYLVNTHFNFYEAHFVFSCCEEFICFCDFFSVFTKHLTDQEGVSKNISHRLMGLTIWPPVCDVGCVGLERYGFAGGSMSLGSDFV